MCGLAGILTGEPALKPEILVARTLRALEHRGPDYAGRKYFRVGQCAFGHARLAILDLSVTGHQPMSTSGGRYWITYNGEIYNYRELRQELDREGLGVKGEAEVKREQRVLSRAKATMRKEQSSFSVPSEPLNSHSSVMDGRVSVRAGVWQSNSDTEVILQAYAQWGKDCVKRLRGMFAFAIWDEQERELFLARDPYGIKPLYYYHSDSTFLFASEVRALLASELVPRKLSREGLASYLQFGSVQDPLTIIDGIRALLPGHVLVVKCRGPRLQFEEFSFTSRCSPKIPNTQNPAPANRREAATQLRTILEDSVRAHLVSDVPVAAFLSGGIDSSAIVALMSRVSGEKQRTFNVTFDEAKFSERSYADVIVRKFGTENEDIRLTEEALIRLLPDALASMDQPTMDGINTYVVSKSVREAGLKVALSGLGGDELFAGYPSFRRALQLSHIATGPAAMRRLISKAGRVFTNGSARHRKLWDLMESDCSPYAAYTISRQLFSPSEIAALIGRDQTSDLTNRLETQHPRPNTQYPNGDIINAVSRYELTGYMSNTLLRDTDHMSMAHALEVRVPFVDREVINYVMALPGEWKMAGRRPKSLLLDALGDLLPEEIWHRPKMGFTLPFERWMKSTLEGEIDQTLSRRDDLSRFGLNSDLVRSTWASFKKSPEKHSWSRLWALFVLERWCENNRVTV